MKQSLGIMAFVCATCIVPLTAHGFGSAGEGTSRAAERASRRILRQEAAMKGEKPGTGTEKNVPAAGDVMFLRTAAMNGMAEV